MNLVELQRALRQLRLGGVAAVLETRLRQAQSETMERFKCVVTAALAGLGPGWFAIPSPV